MAGTVTAGAPLTGTLIRLQFKLSWRQIMASTGMKVAGLVMLLMVLSMAVPAMYGLALLRGASLETRAAITVIGFAALTLGWPIAVTLMTGSNDMLDAGRFALFPVRTRQMLPGLLISAGLGLGGLLTLLLGIGYVMAWSSSPMTCLAAIVGLVLGLATCLVSSRALSATLAGLLRRRRARDMVMVLFVLIVLALSGGIQFIAHALPTDMSTGQDLSAMWASLVAGMQPAVGVAAWTPFGWAWALPWAVTRGGWGTAVVWALLALAWLGFLGWVWMHYFSASLVSPLETGGSAERIAKQNPLYKLMPNTPAGAVAKRGLRYLRRDPRRMIGVITTVIIPFIMAIATFASGHEPTVEGVYIVNVVLSYSPALVAYMSATFIGYDISYDGTALATQIVTGISGRDDRWGRALAYLVIFVPIQVVFIIGFLAWSGQWQLLPGIAGVCFGWLVTGVGIGSWMGSIFQIPQPPAGSNLVNRNGAGGVAGFASAMLGMFIPMVAILPTLALAILNAVFGGVFGWLALLVGVATGWYFLWWGVRAGGRRLDRTWPEVLAKVTWKG